MPDFHLLAELIAITAALSGYPPIPVDKLPPIRILAPPEFAAVVCPENPRECASMAAHFDETGPVIRLVDTLDLEYPRGRSFLVHELVHVMQYQQRGKIGDAGCPENLRSEQEAYRVQNAYLSSTGQRDRFGNRLVSMTCLAQQTSDTHMQLAPVVSP
jgi:hypothetical protein